jgi:hypothetical protein
MEIPAKWSELCRRWFSQTPVVPGQERAAGERSRKSGSSVVLSKTKGASKCQRIRGPQIH